MSEQRILHIPTEVHGRVIVQEASDTPAPLLVGFHGYGESGDSFISSLLSIPNISHWHVVSIQALHPFYSRKMQTVVASWMTRQDRDLAVADNIAYVTRAVNEVEAHVACKSPTVFLGYSQGTAMAYRAAAMSSLRCDGLIALAGDVPVEVETGTRIPSVLIGRGIDDEWYHDGKLERDLALLRRKGSKVETCIFDAGHEWTDTFRNTCGAYLADLRDQ